jgi:hypothetical protein
LKVILRTGKTSLSKGTHMITVEYYENVGQASLSFNYFPIMQLPVQQGGTVHYNWGTGSPASGVPVDHFSACYVTAKHIASDDYIVHAKADDGVRVYVDGKLTLDRWGPSTGNEEETKVHIDDRTDGPADQKDVHCVEVQYYEGVGNSQIEVYLEPIETATDNSMVGELYPNTSLSGTPVIIGGKNSTAAISNLAFDWGMGSPAARIPENNFSARFTKKVNLDAGTYLFNVKSDDGVRVYVDNKPVMDY